MSTFTIPNRNGQIRQDNHGDTRGELWSTFNIDLTSTIGKMKVSKALSKVLDGVDDLENTKVIALGIFTINGKTDYYAVTSGAVWLCSINNDPTDSANWAKETEILISETVYSDIVTFNDLVLISTGVDIASWNGTVDDTDWWTNVVSGTALTALKPHIMHVHRGGQETLFVTDDNKVRYYNSTAGHSTVTLQSDLTASCISSGVSAIWVGTYTESSDHAYVYEIYVGEEISSTPVARAAYKVEGRAVLSIEVIDNIPYIITEKGNLQAFNGAGFSTVAQFPFAYGDPTLAGVRAGLIQDSNIARPIHPKGMRAHNSSLYINLNSENYNSQPINNRTPSGIWEYNKNTQTLNHRYALREASTEYGSFLSENAGPLVIVDNEYTFLIAGGEPDRYDHGLFTESSATKFGYFITPEIQSDTVTDAYESIYHKAKTLASGESIITKYRTTKRDTVYFTGTYADVNVLNTTDDVSTIAVGDEIQITAGYGAGKLAHVESINVGATVTTITLDTSIGSAGQTVDAMSDNWTLAQDTYTSDDGEYRRQGPFGTNPWIQFKVVLTGDIEYRQFINKGNSSTEM